MTTNALATTPGWTKVDASAMPNRWVSRIVIDPNDNKRVYVSFMGYHSDNVWRTTDAGKTWTRITGTGTSALPAAPASALAVHPSLQGCLFVGTDVGLFYSTDDGQTWVTTKDGSRTSPIDELVWKNTRTMLVVTHGRGIYTVDVGEAATTSVVGTGCGKTSRPQLASSPPVIGKTMLPRLHQPGDEHRRAACRQHHRLRHLDHQHQDPSAQVPAGRGDDGTECYLRVRRPGPGHR